MEATANLPAGQTQDKAPHYSKEDERKEALTRAISGQSSSPTFAFPIRLSEKYRPHRVLEFVGLPKAKRVLAKFVAHPYACSFLFFGPPGVGKTSMAQAMAEEMGAEFHHLGSQKCNVENLEEICRICQYVPRTGGSLFFLIEEWYSASKPAQSPFFSKPVSRIAPRGPVFFF